MKQRVIAAALAGVGLVTMHQTVHAHGAWLSRVHGEYHVMWGHDPSNSDPYQPDKVVMAQRVKNGQVKTLPIIRAEKFAYMQADKPGIVSATVDNGFFSKIVGGRYHRLNKAEAAKLGEVQSSGYYKHYTVLYANSREKPKKLGHDLELLPSRNPGQFKKGDAVPVQVFFKGKPLANATIQNNFLTRPKKKIKTDNQGRAMIPVANYGYNAWEVRHSMPYADLKQADKTSWSAIVTFMVPRKIKSMH